MNLNTYITASSCSHHQQAGVHKQQQARRLADFTKATLTPGMDLSLFSDMQTTEPQHDEQEPRRWQGNSVELGFTRTLQANLSRQHISHDLIHVHQLPGSAALGINGGGVSQAQGMQLLPHSRQPIRELRDVGAIQAVYAVGA